MQEKVYRKKKLQTQHSTTTYTSYASCRQLMPVDASWCQLMPVDASWCQLLVVQVLFKVWQSASGPARLQRPLLLPRQFGHGYGRTALRAEALQEIILFRQAAWRNFEETSKILKKSKLSWSFMNLSMNLSMNLFVRACFERVSDVRRKWSLAHLPRPNQRDNRNQPNKKRCKKRCKKPWSKYSKWSKWLVGWHFGVVLADCRVSETLSSQRGTVTESDRVCQAWREFRAQLIARESQEAELLWSQIESAESAERFKMHQDMSRYVKICQDMLRYVKICQDMSRYVKICQDMLRYVKICQDMSRYVKIC